ncbi:MAG: hypothetical protein PHV55_04725 [Candidatus Omnitrophica bacterium]|nr:hypothetical protein [Candidatus Omnitrophota bacterium]
MAKNNQPKERPESYYIKGIQDGTIRVSSLAKETILDVVEVLYAEGSSTVQIAQLLGRNDRSVRRYLKVIRARNAVEPSAQRAKEIVGELIQKANSSYSTLRRLAQSKDGSVGEKVQAEYAAWRVYREFVTALQSLGYLPQEPQEIVGDVFHHSMGADGGRSFLEMKESLREITQVTREAGTFDEGTAQGVKALEEKIQRAELDSEVKKLQAEVNNSREQKEEPHE